MCFHRFIFVPLHPARFSLGLGVFRATPGAPHLEYLDMYLNLYENKKVAKSGIYYFIVVYFL